MVSSGPNKDQFVSRLFDQHILVALGGETQKYIYTAGQEYLVKQLRSALILANYPEERIRTDLFLGYENLK